MVSCALFILIVNTGISSFPVAFVRQQNLLAHTFSMIVFKCLHDDDDNDDNDSIKP